jgi:GntR family transcriptional regulator, arabinose operon transcriptional repressor
MNYQSPSDQDQAGESLPKHERLRLQLLAQLQSGRLRPGDALPTENELAVGAKMSRNTVRQALAELERAGLIRRIRGRGTFFHEQALQRVKFGLDIFALVIPDTRGGYYPSLQRGFHAAAAALNNQVIVCDTDNDPLRQADALLQLLDKKVAGVALVPTTNPATPAHQLRPLHERGIPVVFCHRRVEGLQAPLVTFSALEVGRLAGRAMIERGHRRAAFFSPQRAGLSMHYEQGLRQALREGGGDLPQEFVCYDHTGKATLEHELFLQRHLVELLSHPQRPSALFCSFDSEAELAYLLLQRLGVRVPEEISLVGFGGTWREGALARRLTSVAVDEEELGRKAVGLLAEMRRRERPFKDMTELLLPLGLSQGETLGPAPGSAETAAGR